MKIKTFILTFLMMMSSPFLFGQQHWVPDELYHSGTMQFTSQIYLDGELQTNTDYEVAAFHGNELLAVSKILVIGEAPNQLFHVDLNVKGKDDFGKIYFKLFDGSKEYVSEEEIQFVNQSENGGNHITPTEINFKSVAQIEGTEFDVVYPTIKKAIEAAQAGDVVTILAGEYTQTLNINKAITVEGETDANGNNLVTVQRLNVSGTGATIKNLNANNTSERAMSVSGGNILIENCKLTGVHGLRYCYANNGDVTIKDCIIEGSTYGVHFDAGNGDGDVVIEGCTIKGWTSFGGAIEEVRISNTEFLNGNYNVLRFYQNATVEGVTFPAGMRIDTGNGGTGMEGIKVEFNGCSIDGGNLKDAFPGSVIAKSDIYVDNVLLKREAKIDDTYYETLADAYNAAQDGETITLLDNITLSEKFVIAKSITLDGNGKTLTYTGIDRAIDIYDENIKVEDVTIKNLTLDFTSGYSQRGINYNEDGKLTLEKVTVNGSSVVTYAVNLPSKSTGANVTITDSNITGKIALNVWGANAEINATGSHFTSVDNANHENYAAVKLNNNGTDCAEGAVINIIGGSITAKDENGELSSATTNATATGVINISETTEVIGNIVTTVAIVTYEGYPEFYSFSTLQSAINKAANDANATVKLISNIELSELVKVEGKVVIDLNGKTVTANCKKAFEVYANATIKNGKIWSQQRCVDTRKNVELTLADVTLEAPTYYSTHQNQQPLTIGGSVDGTEIVMTNVNINAGTTGYAIISFVKTNLTATNSNFSGYSALYVKSGSEESEFNFEGSTLEGNIGSNDVEGNSFATIATEADYVTVTLDANSKLKSDGQNHLAISVESEGNEITVTGVIEATNFLDGSTNVNANTIKVKAEYADELLAEGYVTTADDNGLVKVSGLAVAKIGETYYATLAEAFNAAQSGETIQLLADNNENISVGTENLKPYGKTVIVEGNDFEVTGSWKFGRDDNNADNAEITINNVNFKNNGIVVDEFKNVTITNCTFTDITSELAAIRVICDNITEMVTLTGNTIENVSYDDGSGIRVRSAKAATISNNVITNVNFNSILLEGTTNGEVKIENNVLKNWAYANGNAADDGRAIRIAKGEGTLTIANNAMIIGYIAPEEFVKVSGTTSDVNIDANYWNAEEPNAPTHFNAEIGVKSYYAAFDEETKELNDLRLINFVAAIGDNKYQTLTDAITAATAGDVIVLLADITENVTVNKSLTIDGKAEEGAENNTFTGNMNATANITIKNINFDGKGYNGYAVETRSASVVVIEDCTAKNYGYGFLQIASNNHTTTVKNVTISNVKYGVKVDYSNGVVLENVDINAAVAAVLNSNYGEKTITIKDSELSILGTWARNNTIKTTYVFEGANTVDQFIIEEDLDNFKLAIGATLTAVEGLNISATEEGYVVEYNEGVYSVVAGNILNQTTDKKYAKLQAAIDEASENDVIVLLKDITENVTVDKSLTIDGKAEGATANSKYTGKMTVNASLNINIRNIDFVKGYINELGGEHGYFTIVDCNFDGVDKSIGYAVTVRGGDKLTIENSTAKNYSTGMLYIPSAVANIDIKDVEVSNVAAAFNITYSGDGTFENVKVVENVTYGIHFQIYGSRTYTVKNCDLKGATNPFWFWDKSNNTEKVTVVFEGNNDLGTKGITVNAGELQLATDATLTAAEGLNIKATEEGYVVEYNEGVYSVVAGNIALERNGEIVKKFATIQDAIDAAENGDEIVVLKDITLGTGETREYTTTSGGTVSVRALNLISGKSVTIDLNGNTLYCEEEAEENQIYNFFAVTEEGHLTIKDSSEDGTGTVEIKNNDADATTVHSLIMCYNGTMTIENGNYKLHYGKNGNGMIYSQQNETVTVNGGNFWLGNVRTLENHSPWIFNASGRNGNRIIVNGGTFNDDVLHQYYAFEVESSVKNALVNNNDGTWSVITNGAVAHVTERYVYPANYTTNYTNTVGYATLKDAFAAAHTYNYVTEEEMSTVTMLKDVTLDAYVTISKSVNLNLDQFNITRVDGTALYFNGEGIEVTIDGEGTVSGTQAVYVDNGTVTIDGGNYVGGYEAVYVINNGHAVINGGTFGAENDEDDTDFVLNEYDATRDVTTIAVYGGTFHGFNPENNAAEGAGTNFCAQGYGAVETSTGSNIWEVMPVQEQYLGHGFNWYSSYLDITTNDLLSALGESGKTVVLNGSWSATYFEGFGWDYNPHELDFTKMYMIETKQEHTLKLTGELLNAGNIYIKIEKGWNWIGYPSNEKVEINTALENLQATEGDRIVGQGGFADYAPIYGGWVGSLKHLEPTKGYQYNSKNVSENGVTFNYNIAPATTRGNNETVVATHYSVDYTKYPFNMTMVAVVDGAMDDNYEVAALVNGEVRGSARPVYIDVLDAYMLFLTISGDNVEEVSFKYYDLTTGEEYDLVNRIDYSNNAMVGSVNEPYVLSRGTTGIGDAAMSQVNIYPNPTTTGTEINLEAVCDTVEVFNALGVKVAEYQNVDSIDALETAGIYVIRITNDGNVQNCRLVVK